MEDVADRTCRKCGEGMPTRGDTRVKCCVCFSCGAVHDLATDEVKGTGWGKSRPRIILPLGSVGSLHGSPCKVIGIIQYHQHEAGKVYPWVEYLLYIPGKPFCWLVHDENHFVFTWPTLERTDRPVFHSEPAKSSFSLDDKSFQVYESGKATINFMAGEFPWVAEVGEVIRFMDAISPPFLYTQEGDGKEEERFLGEYVPASEVIRGFKLSHAPPEPVMVHGAQPYDPGAIWKGLGYFGPLFGLLNLILWLYLSSPGEPILTQSFAAGQLATASGTFSQEFFVPRANTPYSLQLACPLNNAWAFFDVTVVKDGQPFFTLAQEMAYYQGVEEGEHWTEGDQTVKCFFRIPKPGTYTFAIGAEGGEGESTVPIRLQNMPLNLVLRQNVREPDYSFFLGMFLLLASVPYYAKWYTFEVRRWDPVTEDD